jgi:hypothetical protein
MLTVIISGIYVDNFIDWDVLKWSWSDIRAVLKALNEYRKDKDLMKLMKEISEIISKRSKNSNASQLMNITSLACIENLQTKDVSSATSLANDMIISNKDAATVIFGLLFEFKYGIGPEIREFGENSVLTKGVQDFYLVEEGKAWFYKNEDRKQCKDNPSKLYAFPAKIHNEMTKEDAYIGGFGATGIPQAGLDLVKQYIGGFYMEMLPDKDGKVMEMILYNDVNLKSLVAHYLYINEITGKEIFPEKYYRKNGTVTPLGETRQILKWKEPIDINQLK